MSAKNTDSSTASSREREVARTKRRVLSQERESLAKAFDAAYAKLNPAQKEAVDTTEGPVVVVAGPGTGKTQVLALRVANILKKTQMRPHNILCITFSRSGAVAMRDRLRSLIGRDAYGITIETVHSFCNDIIRDHPHIFSDFSALEQISDIEQYRELNKIIDQHMPGLQLVSAKAPHMRTADILHRISQLKREGVSERDELLRIADEYEEQMRGKSKEGTKAHERNCALAQKFRELITIFFAYQEMLERTHRYDYDDMILFVLQALEEHEWLLGGLQERYQYILVDEFQDLNGAQNRLIEMLTTDPTADASPNLFVVGDDDQAIYRFQGASVQNIEQLYERFPQAAVVSLETSYRCTQPILDAAEDVISHCGQRLVDSIPTLEKRLQASTDEEGVEPRLLLAQNNTLEPWMIADVLEERIKAGIPPSEIAVLVQTNRELEPLYSVLRARGIPVDLQGKIDLLSVPVVMQATAILQAIAHPDDSGFWADALSTECFALPPSDIGKLYLARREHKLGLFELLVRFEEFDLALTDAPRIVAVRDVLLALHQRSGTRTVVQTLECLLKDTGLLVPPSEEDFDVLEQAALQEFFHRIQSRAYEQPGFTLKQLVYELSLYGDQSYSQLRWQYELPHLSDEGVQLMTAHQSKGLEFHTVLLAHFRDRHWDKRRRPASIAVPENLLFGWEKNVKSSEQHDDERRLTFVAITRAKRELLFSCPQRLSSGNALKDTAPSSFFADMNRTNEELKDVVHPEQASTLLHEPARQLDDELRRLLQQRLETFHLSATALNHYLDDPQLFLESDLLQAPQSKSIHYAFGNAVHHVLAKWALGVQSGDVLNETQMQEEFQKHIQQKELLTEKEEGNLLHLGEKILSRYFTERLQPPYPIVFKIEHDVRSRCDDIPLKGKVDRIDLLEPHSSTAVVTDFKTGKPQSEAAIREGDYFRQLAFYAVLLEESGLPIEAQEFVLDFLGDESSDPVQRRFAITTQEREDMRSLIAEVWEKIVALDFTKI